MGVHGPMFAISAINSAFSALRAYGRAVEANAHNMANINTGDYRADEAVFESVSQGGVVVEIEKGAPPPPGQSGVDLVDEMADSISFKAGFQANAAVARAADGMIGTVIDILA